MDQVGVVTSPQPNDLAPCDTHFDIVMRLARDLASVTLNAAIYVEVESKLFSHRL